MEQNLVLIPQGQNRWLGKLYRVETRMDGMPNQDVRQQRNNIDLWSLRKPLKRRRVSRILINMSRNYKPSIGVGRPSVWPMRVVRTLFYRKNNLSFAFRTVGGHRFLLMGSLPSTCPVRRKHCYSQRYHHHCLQDL